jgi:hypothetical protein
MVQHNTRDRACFLSNSMHPPLAGASVSVKLRVCMCYTLQYALSQALQLPKHA